MSKTVQVGMTWFLLSDKWHRESFIHCVEEGGTRSVCGRQEINQANSESMVEFATIDNIPLKDICKVCLRKVL